MEQKILTLTNLQVYNWVMDLTQYFTKDMQLQCSAIDNFIIQYNYYTLFNIAKTIETSKQLIGKKYGTFLPAENSYKINLDKLELAQEEMNLLMDMQVEVSIYLLPLEHIHDMQLSIGQMQALIPMLSIKE